MITKTEIDIQYVDQELTKLFKSIERGDKNPTLNKHKERFFKEKNNVVGFEERRSERLSLAKKLEILCTYGNHKLIKTTDTTPKQHGKKIKSKHSDGRH